MQPEPDRWRARQPSEAAPSRAASASREATEQRVFRTTGSDEAPAPPPGGAPSNGQPSERLHAQLGAALAKLRACTEGGVPPVSGAANRAYQDALKAAHDALTQARSAPGWCRGVPHLSLSWSPLITCVACSHALRTLCRDNCCQADVQVHRRLGHGPADRITAHAA